MRPFIGMMLAGLSLDLLSFIAWAHPPVAVPAMIVILTLTAIAAFRNLASGVAIALLELVWASHGHLLELHVGPTVFSLRMGLFAVVLVAAAWELRRCDAHTALIDACRAHPTRWPACALIVTMVIGTVLGVLRYPFGRAFADANAWAFLALAIPMALALRTERERLRVANFFLLGTGYLVLRAYILLFAFTHDLGGLWFAIYPWMRDVRLGEVTFFTGGFPRIFMPSMVLLFPALFLAARRVRTAADIRIAIPYGALFGGSIIVLLASLSRSFWLAGAAIVAAITVARAMQRIIPRLRTIAAPEQGIGMRRSAAVLCASTLAAIAIAVAALRLPYPTPLATAGLGSTLFGRLTLDEAAVANRWQEIGPLRTAIAAHPILGSGFGSTVTYQSKDPRTLAAFPDGRYTAMSFEWGYLDHALDMGLVGVLALLVLLATLITTAMRRSGDTSALAFGLFAVAIVHVTSPYLNHPLGLGLLAWVFTLCSSPEHGVIA